MRPPRFFLAFVLGLCAGIAQAASSPQFEAVHHFVKGPLHPALPLTPGADGYLYGVTPGGGDDRAGRVYRVSPGGMVEGVGELSTPYTSGSARLAPLTPDDEGRLWGCATNDLFYDSGVIFTVTGTVLQVSTVPYGIADIGGRLLPGGDQRVYGVAKSTETGKPILFQTGYAALTQIVQNLTLTNPQLLVTTSQHVMIGAADSAAGGTDFFRVTTTGVVTVFAHATTDAGTSISLIEGSDGTLYGLASGGGGEGLGSYFRIKSGHDAEVLYRFTSAQGGAATGTLAFGVDGKLYGFTAGSAQTQGIAYRLSVDGAFESLGVLPGAAGTGPVGVAMLGGALYGTLSTGGQFGLGAVVRLDPDGTLTTTASLEPYGIGPTGPVATDAQGNVYGLTLSSGPDLTNGVIYRIAPDGTYSTLARVPDGVGAASAYGLSFGPDDALYGTTVSYAGGVQGGFFRVSLDGAFTLLANFDNASDGLPTGPLHLAADGNFYVFTGGIVRLTSAGALTLLAGPSAVDIGGEFDFRVEGQGTFVDGPDGALYGVTRNGGTLGYGAVVKIDASGTVSVVGSFPDGDFPEGQPAFGMDGALYGQTENAYGIYRWPLIGDPVLIHRTPQSNVNSLGLVAGSNGRLYETDYVYADSGSAFLQVSVPSGVSTYLPYHSFTTVRNPYGTSDSLLSPAPTGYLYSSDSDGFLFRITPADNSPPRVQDARYSVQAGPQVLPVLTTATDADGDALSITSVQGATQGIVTVNPDQTLSYTAGASFSGSDQFTYSVNDGYGGTASATVEVYDTPPTAPPLLTYVQPRKAVPVDLLAQATDPDPGQTLTVAAVTQPAHGSVTLDGGSARYAAGADFAGLDSFSYTVSDGFGGTVTQSVTVEDVPLLVGGNYHGQISYGDLGLGGILQLTVSRTGAFTGFLAAGYPVRIAGHLDTSGSYHGFLSTAGGRVALDLRIDPATHTLTGLLGGTVSLSAGLAQYSLANPAPQAGRYTFVVQGGSPFSIDATKLAQGYGILTVTRKGQATFAGHLADGGHWSASAGLFGDGQCDFASVPFFPGGGFGILNGAMNFSAADSFDASATLSWQNSSHFYTVSSATLYAARYSPGDSALPNSGTASLQYLGGPFSELQLGDLTFNRAGNRLTGTSGTNASILLDRASGLFRGSFSAGGHRYPAAGVLYEKANYGHEFAFGIFPYAGGHGFFDLGVTP